MKHHSLLAVLFAVCLAFVGCDSEVPPPDAAETTAQAIEDIVLAAGGTSEYTLIRPENASKQLTDTAMMLRQYMEACGVKMKLTTDWSGNGKSECEIVIGDTERTAEDGNILSSKAVGESGSYVYAAGKRIYIGGGSDERIREAVERFMTEFFGYTGDTEAATVMTEVKIPGDYSDIIRESFPLSAVAVDGVSLSEFAIVVEEKSDFSARQLAERIQEQLYGRTGFWLEIIVDADEYEGHAIRLCHPADAGEKRLRVYVDEGDILLTCGMSGGLSLAFSQLYAAYFAQAEGELSLSGTLVERELSDAVVRYSDFGAVGDGETDDLRAIIDAHRFANANGIPVQADAGASYYIGAASEGAIIQTDTDWSGASFIIDDSAVGDPLREVSIFTVTGKTAPSAITLTPPTAGQTNIGATFDTPSIIYLANAAQKVYIRKGANANSGKTMEEYILVSPDGTVDPLTPVVWDYEALTKATVQPLEEETLTLRGGTFTTVANRAKSQYHYYNRGITVKRSSVVVENITHYVKGEGMEGAPYNGFLAITDCADITVRDCVFTGHKTYKTRGNDGSVVPMGSYDITVHGALRVSFTNCRQTNDIQNTVFWGLMNTNFVKDITLDTCEFSRYDAHEGATNVTLRNCIFGHHGINAIGFGTLLVENTTSYGTWLITFRGDYGSTWTGDVILRNCTWVPQQGKRLSGKKAIFYASNDGTHDFGYDCTLTEHITIENLTVVDTKADGSYSGLYLFENLAPACTDAEKAAALPYPIRMPETVTVSGMKIESGKGWELCANPFLFRNTAVTEDGAERK